MMWVTVVGKWWIYPQLWKFHGTKSNGRWDFGASFFRQSHKGYVWKVGMPKSQWQVFIILPIKISIKRVCIYIYIYVHVYIETKPHWHGFKKKVGNPADLHFWCLLGDWSFWPTTTNRHHPEIRATLPLCRTSCSTEVIRILSNPYTESQWTSRSVPKSMLHHQGEAVKSKHSLANQHLRIKTTCNIEPFALSLSMYARIHITYITCIHIYSIHIHTHVCVCHACMYIYIYVHI